MNFHESILEQIVLEANERRTKFQSVYDSKGFRITVTMREMIREVVTEIEAKCQSLTEKEAIQVVLDKKL